MTIATQILHWSQTRPNHPAIVMDDPVTYGELRRRVADWLTRLEVLSVSPSSWGGDRLAVCTVRVGLLLPNHIEGIAAFLATAIAGGVTMVLNPDWSPSQIQAVLRQYPPNVLITTAAWEAIAPGIPTWVIDENPEHLANNGFPLIQTLDRAIAPDTPFYIGFTSGTTGTPKGILRHHQSWLDSFVVSRQELGITDRDRVLVPGSIAYSLSLFTVLDALNTGATVHLSPSFNPRWAVRQLSQVTVVVGVPTMVDAIARVSQRQRNTWDTVRSVICAGASCPAALHDTTRQIFPNAVQQVYYGASELSFISLWSSNEQPPTGSVGRIMPGVQVSICRDNGDRCNTGETGFITVHSSMLSLGYLVGGTEMPLRYLGNAATVGDRGWIDKNGWLYLAGRESDRITTGGLTLYPAELERVLEAHPVIQQAVVLGIPDERRGDRLVAVLVCDDLSQRQIRDWMRSRVSRAKCPHDYYRVDNLPVAVSGKCDRRVLEQWVMDAVQQLEFL
jgi:acyl-CoA synthetase (AMP-forming)/AMP-acid ligase II